MRNAPPPTLASAAAPSAATVRDAVGDVLNGIRLVDHHAHSVFADDLDDAGFETALSESGAPLRRGATAFDSQLGFAIRRICAPVLGLEPFAAPEVYLRRRRELGTPEATRRLLDASGVDEVLVDGGYAPESLLGEAQLFAFGLRIRPIVRLEAVAEASAAAASDASGFMAELDRRLDETRATAAGYKTVAAYRTGLALPPARPTDREVTAAAARWLARLAESGAPPRLTDQVLIRHLIWWAIDAGAVLQVHAGFGDSDLRLAGADPLLLQPLIARSAGSDATIALLHCYPFERAAGFLCHTYPHVVMDVGLAVSHLGAAATGVVARSLELAPFSAVLFSTDAWGLPERYAVGARLWREAMTDVLAGFVQAGRCSLDDAARVAKMIGRENAARIYG
ncbi:amidohydrolase family protein [Microbacterium sp. LWH3-1.2]|uniref:amidohydrolase family protein n=1 Tax=Microbacterium sp. LWH3-1.2 TaxID=3135256 RepID=UPI003419E8E4